MGMCNSSRLDPIHPDNIREGDCYMMQEPELNYDERKLLYWLRQRNIGEFIITTVKVDWSEFKKRLVFKDGQVVYVGTGEMVDGVTVVNQPPLLAANI